jgi:hypothetical protein
MDSGYLFGAISLQAILQLETLNPGCFKLSEITVSVFPNEFDIRVPLQLNQPCLPTLISRDFCSAVPGEDFLANLRYRLISRRRNLNSSNLPVRVVEVEIIFLI